MVVLTNVELIVLFGIIAYYSFPWISSVKFNYPTWLRFVNIDSNIVEKNIGPWLAIIMLIFFLVYFALNMMYIAVFFGAFYYAHPTNTWWVTFMCSAFSIVILEYVVFATLFADYPVYKTTGLSSVAIAEGVNAHIITISPIWRAAFLAFVQCLVFAAGTLSAVAFGILVSQVTYTSWLYYLGYVTVCVFAFWALIGIGMLIYATYALAKSSIDIEKAAGDVNLESFMMKSPFKKKQKD